MADHVPEGDDQQKFKDLPSSLLPNTLEVEQPIIINPSRLKITEPVASNSSGKHPLYRGIRSRSGKWVAEIREPRKTSRIWLGTYPTPEMAAAAYDAASLVLKGPGTALNFPAHNYNNLLPVPTEPPTAATIRVAAANAAASRAVASQTLALPAPQLAQNSNTNVTGIDTDILEMKEEYVDEEELFDMPNLLMAMAEGMLVSPPRITISPPPSHDSESLWSLSNINNQL